MLSNETPKQPTKCPTQRLPPEGAYHCERCKNLVVFRTVRTKPSRTLEGKMIAYLVCPTCGHRATQMRFRKR